MTTFSPDESTPKTTPPQNSSPKPDPEPFQRQTRDLSLPAKVCTRCHKVKSLNFFMRGAKNDSRNEFEPEEMSVCNWCVFDEHNKRAAGEHKQRMPKGEGMQKQLSEEEYAELYGAEAVIKETPTRVKREKRDDEDGDDAKCAPS